MEAKLTEIPAYDLTIRLSEKERHSLRKLCNTALTHPAAPHFNPDEQTVARALYKALGGRQIIRLEDDTEPSPQQPA